MEPYRRAGFVITSQSDGATTLVHHRAKFNYLLFVILLLVWPLALLYFISFNNQKERMVCLRVTSQGEIEERRYTLAAAEKDRRREKLVNSIIIITLIIVLIGVIFWILHLTGNL